VTPRIGTAGWSIPKPLADRFPSAGTALERYDAVFNAVEINTSFYRSHRLDTYARWRDSAPAGFRFAVKTPRTITHYAKLKRCDELLAAFVAEAGMLGEKLGPLLVQLPPSLAFDTAVAQAFFETFRSLFGGDIACEPRHASWFGAEADALLVAHRIARVAADPARHPAAGAPGGWLGLAYWRLHGSPRIYYSPYDDEVLRTLAARLGSGPAAEIWCIFDNTASGAAAADALALRAML
jgi:uncharacterized protein YecE (DUF72 family)